MTKHNIELALSMAPTFQQRFWRAMGFRYILNELPENVHDTLPGWMITKTVYHFGFLDRLRLLTSGRTAVDMRQATSPQVDKCVSAASFRILHPMEKP
jgi:hypothetical protein